MNVIASYLGKVADKIVVGVGTAGILGLAVLCYPNIAANWKLVYWQIAVVCLLAIGFLLYWLFACAPKIMAWKALGSNAVFSVFVTIVLLSAVPTGTNWYPNFSILFGLVAFFAGSTICLAAKKALILHDISDNRKLGFAVTGITYQGDSVEAQQFILVFNKNVRSGKGLWLPPGGRYFPAFEHPEEKLRAKIHSELGQSVVIEPTAHPSLPERDIDHITKTVRWYQPPFFILREDFEGPSNHGHTQHFDLIYLCRLQTTDQLAKCHYPTAERLHVPVKDCATSYESALNASYKAISADHQRRYGKAANSYDTLTTDLVWRMHLASKYLTTK